MLQSRCEFFKAGAKLLQQINLFTGTREAILFKNVCLTSEGKHLQGGVKVTFFHEVCITRSTIMELLSQLGLLNKTIFELNVRNNTKKRETFLMETSISFLSLFSVGRYVSYLLGLKIVTQWVKKSKESTLVFVWGRKFNLEHSWIIMAAMVQ